MMISLRTSHPLSRIIGRYIFYVLIMRLSLCIGRTDEQTMLEQQILSSVEQDEQQIPSRTRRAADSLLSFSTSRAEGPQEHGQPLLDFTTRKNQSFTDLEHLHSIYRAFST